VQKVWRTSRSQDNKRLARELMFAFADVEISRQPELDLRAWRNERGASHYVGLDRWCRAILNKYSASPSAGKLEFDSFLFPAEKLFEAYVAEKLKVRLANVIGMSVKSQVNDQSLFAQQKGPFRKRHDLRPDIVITLSSGSAKEILILDTKWKIYDDKNAQVAQADLYQLFAYANYWSKDGYKVHVALIAPEAARLLEPSTHAYIPGNNLKIPLSMLPYDLLEKDALISPSEHGHFKFSVTLNHIFNGHNVVIQ